jgi:hypothetical protein
MSVLTVVYAGQTIHNAEVTSFSFESNANGDLFIAAGTREIEDDVEIRGDGTGVALAPIKPEDGQTLDADLDPDGRFTADELEIIRRRGAFTSPDGGGA